MVKTFLLIIFAFFKSSREAKYLQTFDDLAQSETCIVVPKVVADFSTPEILMMSFEEGYEFDSMDHFAPLEREHIAHLLVTWTIREIFEFQLVCEERENLRMTYGKTACALS